MSNLILHWREWWCSWYIGTVSQIIVDIKQLNWLYLVILVVMGGMTVITVTVHEAKTNLSSLLRVVEQQGEKVVITRHGTAVAELVPVARGVRTDTHSGVREITLLYDPTEPTQGEWDNV
jgi:prevent-host-death family protein